MATPLLKNKIKQNNSIPVLLKSTRLYTTAYEALQCDYFISLLSVPHNASGTWASLLFSEHTRHFLTSAPLHSLLPATGMPLFLVLCLDGSLSFRFQMSSQPFFHFCSSLSPIYFPDNTYHSLQLSYLSTIMFICLLLVFLTVL